MRGKGILIANDFDLIITPARDASGRIVSGLQVGNTLYQNQALILILQPGELKLSPVIGTGIDDITLDNDFLGWRRKIRQQLELDGQVVRKITITNSKQINIDAEYRNS